MYNYSSSTVLITGASRGIGAALAREVARRGAVTLILTARAEDELRALADELSAAHPLRAEVIALDLTEEDAPRALKAETDRRGLTVDILVNNAGYGSYGFFDGLPPERERGMVALNVSALVELTNRYLPGMIARNRGGILNVSSTGAFQPVPFMATYGATKAFVQSFTEALWGENEERGGSVHITALCPGGTESNFGANVGVARGKFEDAPQMSASDVARIGWDGWERNRAFIVAGLANYAGTLGARLLPRESMARFAASLFRPSDLAPRPGHGASRTRVAVGAAVLGTVVLGAAIARARRR